VYRHCFVIDACFFLAVGHYGSPIALLIVVLKITVQDEPKTVTLRLEGRIAGSWVAEFDRTWHSLAPSLESKKLRVDLREVSYIDARGQQILSDICKNTGADFQTDSMWIDWMVQEARQGNHEKSKGEPK
jgi:hypothetical protein